MQFKHIARKARLKKYMDIKTEKFRTRNKLGSSECALYVAGLQNSVGGTLKRGHELVGILTLTLL